MGENALKYPEILARRGDRLNYLAQRIESNGGKALPIVADVTMELLMI